MYVTPKQMQMLERLTDASGCSYAQMMAHAGAALASYLQSHFPQSASIVLLAGTGNNGGDCYEAAAMLKNAGWQPVLLAPFGEPKTEISRNAREKALLAHVPIVQDAGTWLDTADVAVDGLYGTGFHGTLLPEAADLLRKCQNAKFRVACDIPSGGNGCTGSADDGTFQADATITFGAVKLGLGMYPLCTFCGEVHCADIGIPENAFAALDIPPTEALTKERLCLPSRREDSYKNMHGHLLAVTGSVRMRGACVLSAAGAFRSGVGLLTVASAEPALQALSVRLPEAMCLPMETDAEGFLRYTPNLPLLETALQGKQALLIGCGMGCTEETEKLTEFLLRYSECPVVMDADGLNLLAHRIEWIPRGRTILTPHPAEAARLLGMTTAQVQADRLAAARTLAETTGAVVILKGAGTIVADGKRSALCRLGNAGMARAGSGDVLAGITASLAAQGFPLYEAACTAVTLHAAAGDAAAAALPQRYMLPQDLISALQEVIQ